MRALSIILLAACAGPKWNASALLLDPERLVAEALGDDPPGDGFDVKRVPLVPPPTLLRPCCAFGMDLRFGYGGVPLYTLPNIVEQLGPHQYDNGTVTFDSNGHFLNIENNGTVFTCRGGFIDTAHVRDNADMAFFFATRLLAVMPRPLVLDFDTLAARIHLKVDVPTELLQAHGRFAVAASVAEWLAYQEGLWHEIAQWWGYRFSVGYPEQVSAFSPEDLYSNALGARLGALSVRNKMFRSREDYNAGVDASFLAALQLLGVQPKARARAAMHAVDGVWWSSKSLLPDNAAVPRRNVAYDNPLTPWLLSDLPADVPEICSGTQARSLSVETHLSGLAISSFASITWTPKEWAGAGFPFASADTRSVHALDLPRLVAETRAQMESVLGRGFDAPAGPRDEWENRE